MTTPREIMSYWLGESTSDPKAANERLKMWYGSKRSIDEEIRDRFAETLREAERGKLDAWKESSEGCLALVILLDQFSRNLYRRTPDAFKNDPAAYAVASHAIEQGFDAKLPAIGRAFLYHPFHHSESLEVQDKGVALFEKLWREAPPKFSETIRGFFDSAREHRDIVKTFGRFPHRNQVLGRQSTAEEMRYLKNGKTFGQ